MNVRQLEEFIGSGDQRVFHILTVSHLYGGIAGTVIGAWFLQPLLGIWGFFLGGTLGLTSTWKRSGRPLYGWAFAYVRFVLRALFKMGDVRIDAAEYYASHRARSAPYMVMRADGSVVMVNRGTEPSYDSLDRLLVMPAGNSAGRGIRTNALRGDSSTEQVLSAQSASPGGGGPERHEDVTLPRRKGSDKRTNKGVNTNIEAWGLD